MTLCSQQEKEKRMNEGRAFQLLYLHLGLQLFTHQRETLDVLKVISLFVLLMLPSSF